LWTNTGGDVPAKRRITKKEIGLGIARRKKRRSEWRGGFEKGEGRNRGEPGRNGTRGCPNAVNCKGLAGG